ncbi:hypothetical protein V6N13_105859 [Hibiscus sabdariffa]|uniref:Uncharacterized protein n=1 Tax=Hibiscus sabdariffa TaxID=183260 RepID=A0ABR2EYY3_9ROSI
MLSLEASKRDTKRIENVENEVKLSGSCIQDIEEGLEGVLRQLIKVRVNILNSKASPKYHVTSSCTLNPTQIYRHKESSLPQGFEYPDPPLWAVPVLDGSLRLL